MLKSIFYARFHQERGSTVLHQCPEGSIIPLATASNVGTTAASVTGATSMAADSGGAAMPPLFDFSSVSDYIIPRREFCDRLVSVCSNRYRIIGYPVCIHDESRYVRGDFIFNFCLVLDEDAPWTAYASVVKKLARLFRNLEEQGQFLSLEEENEGRILAGEEGYGGHGGARVYAVCEMILEDLNNYCECMIPIDESNTLNLKLFPHRPNPPPIYTWHVPLPTVHFSSSSFQTTSWDLTVQRILPHLNGINSVARIAELADTDTSLTRRAVQHLLYYGCILLLDIFSFSAIYAPTAEIRVFVRNESMIDECRRYISSPYSPFGKPLASQPIPPAAPSTSTSNQPQQPPHLRVKPSSRLNPSRPPAADTKLHPPSRHSIISLYASLRQGLTLRDWCLAHAPQLAAIDVRRLITFGVIKGFLYRVHKYAIALKPGELMAGVDLDDPVLYAKMQERAWRKAAMSSGWATPRHELAGNPMGAAPVAGGGGGGTQGKARQGDDDAGPESATAAAAAAAAAFVHVAPERGQVPEVGGARNGVELGDAGLARYVDGMHRLDEICTELKIPEKDAVKRLRRFGDVVFVGR